MGAMLAIAGKDLQQRFRDRSAIILGFVAPLLIAALMSLAFRNTDTFHSSLGFVSNDRGPVASALHDLFAGPQLKDTFSVKRFGDEAALRRAVHDHDVDVGLVVPADFSASVTSAHATSLLVLGSTDTELATGVAQSVADAFLARINADRAAVGAAVVAGRATTRQQLEAAAHRAESTPLPVGVVRSTGGDKQLKVISYYAPAMGIFFVLFAIGFGARGWFLERDGGTLDRMRAAPLPLHTLLLGKALSTFVYAFGSLGTTALVSSLAFGADWGNPVAVAILCAAVSVSVVVLTMLVITVARTDRQADGVASIVTFALAIAGGNFVLSANAPDALRALALWTPNGWALRGFTDLATGATGTSTVVEPLLGIAAFTAAALAVTALTARRVVAR